MTSPIVAGLPSLPAVERAVSERVIESEKTGFFKMAALMRGPPQAEAGAVKVEDGARDGKAISDRVSN